MIICHLYKEQDISNIFSTSIFPKYIFNESHPHSHQLCHQNPQNDFLFLVCFPVTIYTLLPCHAFAMVEVVKHKVVVRKLRRAQVKCCRTVAASTCVCKSGLQGIVTLPWGLITNEGNQIIANHNHLQSRPFFCVPGLSKSL